MFLKYLALVRLFYSILLFVALPVDGGDLLDVTIKQRLLTDAVYITLPAANIKGTGLLQSSALL